MGAVAKPNIRIEKLDKKLRTPTKTLCLDIDTMDKITNKPLRDWETAYKLLKALYSYTPIKRKVVETEHGYHIYIKIDITKLDCDRILQIRLVLGDDIERAFIDHDRCKHGYWINVCFQTSEK